MEAPFFVVLQFDKLGGYRDVKSFCHSEERSDEESLSVNISTLVEILRFAQNDIHYPDKLEVIGEFKFPSLIEGGGIFARK